MNRSRSSNKRRAERHRTCESKSTFAPRGSFRHPCLTRTPSSGWTRTHSPGARSHRDRNVCLIYVSSRSVQRLSSTSLLTRVFVYALVCFFLHTLMPNVDADARHLCHQRERGRVARGLLDSFITPERKKQSWLGLLGRTLLLAARGLFGTSSSSSALRLLFESTDEGTVMNNFSPRLMFQVRHINGPVRMPGDASAERTTSLAWYVRCSSPADLKRRPERRGAPEGRRGRMRAYAYRVVRFNNVPNVHAA